MNPALIAKLTTESQALFDEYTGSYDTRTIDKDITAVMTVTFRVD